METIFSPDGKIATLLGIVIVTYNSAGVLSACLESCRFRTDASIVVIDNASEDNSVQIARAAGAIVCANPVNRGFAAAVNQGVQQLEGDLVLLLNPDTELLTPIDALMNACCEPQVAAAAGTLLDIRTHRPQKGFSIRRLPSAGTLLFETLGLNRLFPWNPVNRWYRCLDFDPSLPAFVEQPAGAFFLFRRDAWQQLNGFDEAFYPIWFEDVDFCKRLIDGGWQIKYVPESRAVHEGGHSAGKLDRYRKSTYWYVSLLRYAYKHFSKLGFRLVCAAVLLRCTMIRILERDSSKTMIRELPEPLSLARNGFLRGVLR